MKNLYIKRRVDISSVKSMFNFLHDHYRAKLVGVDDVSIANNMSLTKMGLDGKISMVKYFLDLKADCGISKIKADWEKTHPDYKVLGLLFISKDLMLVSRKWSTILPKEILSVNSYDEFKKLVGKDLKSYKDKFRELTLIVREFDELCESVRQYLNVLSLANKEDADSQDMADIINLSLNDFITE